MDSKFPPDVLFILIDKADIETLINYYKTDRYMNKLIKYQGEKQMTNTKKSLELDNKDSEDKNIVWKRVIKKGLRPAILFLILETDFAPLKNILRIIDGIKCAAQGGYKDLVIYFVDFINSLIQVQRHAFILGIEWDVFWKQGIVWERGMRAAAKGGHLHLVEYFINKSVVGNNYWWREAGLFSAAYGGHKDLIEYFVDKNKGSFTSFTSAEWNGGLFYAAIKGHKNLITYLIEKGANDWNKGMLGATKGGHLQLVLYFVDKGANNWSEGLMSAAINGHKELVEYFISKENDNLAGWNTGLVSSASGGHLHLIHYFIDKGATDLRHAIDTATRFNFIHIADYLRSLQPEES